MVHISRYSLFICTLCNNILYTQQRTGYFATKTTYKAAFHANNPHISNKHHGLKNTVSGTATGIDKLEDLVNETNDWQIREFRGTQIENQHFILQDIGDHGIMYLTQKNWPDFCSPVQVNAVIRHGIRNAGHKEVDRFLNVFHRISTSVQKNHPNMHDAMNRLQDVVTKTAPKLLLKAGRAEQQLLAQRLLTRYSDLFSSKTNSHDILFEATSSSRTVESCESFISEWHLVKNTVHFIPEIEVNDVTLRFFDHCEKYIEEVENNKKSSLKEYYTYVKHTFGDIAVNISTRLGLDESHAITSKEVKALFILAAIETATLGTSEMEKMFDETDLMKVEYGIDLKNYWKKSYGHQINYQQSCPLLADIVKQMKSVVNGQSYHKGIFRFAHAETILPLQALIGLFKDNLTLRSDNFDDLKERLFKTSKIAPFSGNVVFVLFECDERAKKPDDVVWEKHMVQLLINEVPYKIPGCDQELCPFTKLIDIFQNILESCNSPDPCALHDEL